MAEGDNGSDWWVRGVKRSIYLLGLLDLFGLPGSCVEGDHPVVYECHYGAPVGWYFGAEQFTAKNHPQYQGFTIYQGSTVNNTGIKDSLPRSILGRLAPSQVNDDFSYPSNNALSAITFRSVPCIGSQPYGQPVFNQMSGLCWPIAKAKQTTSIGCAITIRKFLKVS